MRERTGLDGQPSGMRTAFVGISLGRVSVVDASDLPLISGHRWWVLRNRTCYAITHIHRDGKRTTISMHRLIMGAQPGQFIDHRDGDGLNNVRSNLRFATCQQNAMNARQKNHSSQFKGVSWRKDRGHWTAKIRIGCRDKFLGCFHEETEAAKAYNLAARQIFGKFARLNQF